MLKPEVGQRRLHLKSVTIGVKSTANDQLKILHTYEVSRRWSSDISSAVRYRRSKRKELTSDGGVVRMTIDFYHITTAKPAAA